MFDWNSVFAIVWFIIWAVVVLVGLGVVLALGFGIYVFAEIRGFGSVKTRKVRR